MSNTGRIGYWKKVELIATISLMNELIELIACRFI